MGDNPSRPAAELPTKSRAPDTIAGFLPAHPAAVKDCTASGEAAKLPALALEHVLDEIALRSVDALRVTGPERHGSLRPER